MVWLLQSMLQTQPNKSPWHLTASPFYRCGDSNISKWNDLPKANEGINVRDRIKSRKIPGPQSHNLTVVCISLIWKQERETHLFWILWKVVHSRWAAWCYKIALPCHKISIIHRMWFLSKTTARCERHRMCHWWLLEQQTLHWKCKMSSLWDVSPALFLKTNFFLCVTQLAKAALKLTNTSSVLNLQQGAYCGTSEVEQEVCNAHFSNTQAVPADIFWWVYPPIS